MKLIRKLISGFLLIYSTHSVAAFNVPPVHLTVKNSSQWKLLDITVGHRTNDSTGQLSISNATIQQSIISVITLLNTTTITADNSTLFVSPNSVYLQFNVTDTGGVKSYIAVQLSENTNGDFIFHPGAGKELHILTSSGSCPGCMYIKESGRINVTNCNVDGCKYAIHFSM